MILNRLLGMLGGFPDRTNVTMSARRIYIFDSTLRDGAQTQGIDFSAADKMAIAGDLDALGVDYVEGGWPGANPTDDAFFAVPPTLKQARLTAFGMTRRAGRSAENDPGVATLLDVGTPAVCIVGKTWDFQARVALGVEEDENRAMIADTIRHAAANTEDWSADNRDARLVAHVEARTRDFLSAPTVQRIRAEWLTSGDLAAAL